METSQPPPQSLEDFALEMDRRKRSMEERRDRSQRGRAALVDAAALRALNATALKVHFDMPADGSMMGALRVLWNGWLETWAEFYQAHHDHCSSEEEPLSERARARLARHEEVLDGVQRMIEFCRAIDETAQKTPTRRAMLATAARHWRALPAWSAMFLNIEMSERQLLTPFPVRSSVPDGVTRH